MAIKDSILASQQLISLDVRIGGTSVEAHEASASLGITQANSQCTISCTSMPAITERQEVVVFAGYDGNLVQIFGGEYTGDARSYFPGRVELTCRDRLALAQFPWAGDLDREYIAQDDAAVIRNLLEAMGLPSFVSSIESSGWTVGSINPVVCKKGDVPLNIVQSIDEVAGYRTFVKANGSIYRRRISGDAGATSVWTCEEGVDIISIRRRRTIEGIRNKWTVTGYSYLNVPIEQTAQASSPYIPTPPQYVGGTLQSELIETDAKALAVAQRLLSDSNRRSEAYELEIIGNPLIQPGDTITVIHSQLGGLDAINAIGAFFGVQLDAVVNSRFLVDTVSHRVSASGFRTTIQTWAGGK